VVTSVEVRGTVLKYTSAPEAAVAVKSAAWRREVLRVEVGILMFDVEVALLMPSNLQSGEKNCFNDQ
jgi:hypothetical protein